MGDSKPVDALPTLSSREDIERYLETLFGRHVKPDRSAGGMLLNQSIGNGQDCVAMNVSVEAMAKAIQKHVNRELFIKTSLFDIEKHRERVTALRAEKPPKLVGGSKDCVSTVVACCLDVDAQKAATSGEYLSRADALKAIGEMPIPPTMIVSTRPGGGLHVYWCLEQSIPIAEPEDLAEVNKRFCSWRKLLDEKVKAINATARIDTIYEASRVLRPVGSKRKNGDPVELLVCQPERLYAIDDVSVDGWDDELERTYADVGGGKRERVIGRYLDSVELTVPDMLCEIGGIHEGNGKWRRDADATPGSCTEHVSEKTGRNGITIRSENWDLFPKKHSDGKGSWYSDIEMFVIIRFGRDYQKAAVFCRTELAFAESEAKIADSGDGKQRYVANGYEVWEAPNVGYSAKKIAQMMHDAHDGWPKIVGGKVVVPFVEEDGTNYVRELYTGADMKGWLQRDDDCELLWLSAGGTMLSGEAVLSQIAAPETGVFDSYAMASKEPHFPMMKSVLYTNPIPTGEGSTGRYLDEFIGFFSFASPMDKLLAKTLLIQLCWGGDGGDRRGYVIDAKSGTAQGKTAFAELFASMAGSGFVKINHGGRNYNDDANDKKILSPKLAHKRMILIDNVKGDGISDPWLESLITTSEFVGDVKYAHATSMPNYKTALMTANGATFCRDLAQRFAKILLDSPTDRAKWLTTVRKFIKEHRADVMNDIAAIMSREPHEVPKPDRFAAWCEEILGRVATSSEHAAEVLEHIKKTALGDDVDATHAEDLHDEIEVFIEAMMPTTTTDADSVHLFDLNPCHIGTPNLFIETDVMWGIANRAFETRFKDTRQSSKKVNHLISKGSIDGWLKLTTEKVQHNKRRVRGFVLNPTNGIEQDYEKLNFGLLEAQPGKLAWAITEYTPRN